MPAMDDAMLVLMGGLMIKQAVVFCERKDVAGQS
jgi:hypothetical protein